jgi:hypothetical protein
MKTRFLLGHVVGFGALLLCACAPLPPPAPPAPPAPPPPTADEQFDALATRYRRNSPRSPP